MQQRTKRGCGCLLFVLVLAALLAAFLYSRANREDGSAQALANAAHGGIWWDKAYQMAAVEGELLEFPPLAAGGLATMHADAAQSDVHRHSAPTGDDLSIRSRKAGGKLPRQCSTLTFRRDGLLVAMCGGAAGFRLTLIDPDTLAALATYDLGMRSSALKSLITRDLSHTFSDSSGGAYFVLDAEDRVVLGDPRQRIKRIAARGNGNRWSFEVEQEWDMSSHVPNDCLWFTNWFPKQGQCDGITTVIPWVDGKLWWTTRGGLVGTLDPDSGAVSVTRRQGGEIQNALAAEENAVAGRAGQAQYAMRSDEAGKPVPIWRHAYDRGSARKLGAINQGSGTTPTLLGERYITFTDNADGRINLVVLRRGLIGEGETREICRLPLFTNGASAAENSMIGIGRSIVIENNSGYTNAVEHSDWTAIRGGVSRIDIRSDESGCDEVWASDLVVPSVVPKLSQPSGIAYFYSFELDDAGVPQWYIAGLDWQTGALVQKIPTGSGAEWNNNWSALAIGPDGSLYSGTARGLLQVRTR